MASAKLIQTCNQLIQNGEKAKAQEILKKQLQQDVHDETAWLLLAIAMDTKEQRKKILTQAIKFNPESVLINQQLKISQNGINKQSKAEPKRPKKNRLPFFILVGIILFLLCILGIQILRFVSKFVEFNTPVNSIALTDIKSTDVSPTSDGFFLYQNNQFILIEPIINDIPASVNYIKLSNTKPIFYIKNDEIDLENLRLKKFTYGIGIIGSQADLGLKIDSILPSSPAESSELMVDDIILTVNGEKLPLSHYTDVRTNRDIVGYPNETVLLEVLRGTTTISIAIQRSFRIDDEVFKPSYSYTVTPTGSALRISMDKSLEPGFYYFTEQNNTLFSMNNEDQDDYRSWLFFIKK